MIRSLLVTPGSDWRKIQKAVASEADQVLIDLEDAVAPGVKAESRAQVVRAARELDWRGRPVAYRVNAPDTAYCYRDIIEVVEQAGLAIGLIVVPKIGQPEELVFVATLLTQIELHLGIAPGAIGLGAQIESASGLLHAERIAQATSRLTALHFGPADFAASIGMPQAAIGVPDAWDDAYAGHRVHYPMAQVVIAARAFGLEAIDGPFADFRDGEGFRTSCQRARALGYSGKWCIHPSQIAIANEVFSPSSEEIAQARRIIEAYQTAVAAGNGAISLDGRMIDAASIRLAQAVLGSLDESENAVQLS
jgi:citrate lyase subunit beta/citryl-CoA lyase